MTSKLPPVSGARFWQVFRSTGLLHADLGRTESSLIDNPRALIAHVLGAEANFIRPEKVETPVAASSVLGEAPVYVTSPSSYFPPHLLVYLMPQKASADTKIWCLDSWYLLQDAENRSPDLYANLFSRLRVMRFERAAWVAPTFSVRNDCLIFAQPPRLGEKDKIGERVKSWTTHREPAEITLGPGEMLVVDNHRFAHRVDASNAGAGLEIYAVWTERGATTPSDKHMAAARQFRHKLDAAFPEDAQALRIRFGLADCSLDDYIRASVSTPPRMEHLMSTYQRVFQALQA